jgi:hypothetical protein
MHSDMTLHLRRPSEEQLGWQVVNRKRMWISGQFRRLTITECNGISGPRS